MDAQAATAYVCEYIQRWCADIMSLRNVRPSVSTTDVAATLVLLASGRGPARIPTCEHILRYMRYTDESAAVKLRPLLLRTLSLFGPGELRALRVMSPKCFDVIVPELDRPDDSGAVRLTQALSSLRVVAWGGSGTSLELAFGFIEWHGAALTDLHCNFWSRDNPAANRALARCARLESLSSAQSYNAKVWLGLTNLHTLRGVDLGVVSVAAIAAALPRLHTLAAFINVVSQPPVPHTAVAGFFEDLVPRLRALHYHGPWPTDDQAPDRATTAAIVPQPLPLLQELIFRCLTVPPVEREFMGAQPAMLEMSHAAVTDMLVTAPLIGGEATYRPLARVRDLCLTSDGDNPHSSDVARLLRAAPQLRKLKLESLPDLLNDPAFTGLVLPWLRSIHVGAMKHAHSPANCGMQLRRLHFPRLQQLIVNSMHHLVHDE